MHHRIIPFVSIIIASLVFFSCYPAGGGPGIKMSPNPITLSGDGQSVSVSCGFINDVYLVVLGENKFVNPDEGSFRDTVKADDGHYRFSFKIQWLDCSYDYSYDEKLGGATITVEENHTGMVRTAEIRCFSYDQGGTLYITQNSK